MAVKSAERTIRILEAYAAGGEPLALSELARRVAIPVSACYGLVRTLLSRGYLYELGPRKGYYPTMRWLEQARLIAQRDPVLGRVSPLLEALSAATGETVVLGKRLEIQVLYLAVVEAQNPIRYSAHAGELKPLHSSAAGKALLGSLGAAERDALLRSLKLNRITANTITRREALEKDLATGAARGWYLTRGENVPDVHAIAAPVRLASDTCAIVVAGPAHRIEAHLRSHARRLLRACRAAEAR